LLAGAQIRYKSGLKAAKPGLIFNGPGVNDEPLLTRFSYDTWMVLINKGLVLTTFQKMNTLFISHLTDRGKRLPAYGYAAVPNPAWIP